MSLRSRLLVGLGVVALVLVGAAYLVTRTTESYLIDRVDQQLASVPLQGGGDSDHDHHGPDPFTNLNSVYIASVNADGSLSTVTTPYAGAGDVALPNITHDDVLARPDHAFTVASTPPSSTRYRVLFESIPGPVPHTYAVALPLTDVDAAVSRLIGLEAVATLLIIAILGLVVFWVLRLGVRPIKRMTETATAIAAGDLSHRVPAVASGTEAGDLGIALNKMLGHIEDAFAQRTASEDRLRRFVGDASHELRTPVTTIRGYAELYRTGGLRDDDDLAQAMRRTEQEAIRMGALIEDLLLLARLDQGRPLDRAPVAVDDLARDAVADARAVAPDRSIELDEPIERVVVAGDEFRLRQVLGNLVGNALVHTPAGTAVRVSVRRDGDCAVVEVRDEGPGMPSDVAANAFERFYRADASRSRAHGGAGLGLAIVQAIVVAHGGAATITSAPGAGTTVRIELPTAHDAATEAAAAGATTR